MPESWTIGRLLTWTTDYLKQHHAESPRLDAEVLLAHARGCPRIQLYASFEDVAADDLRTSFRELVKKRAEGMPVAYLVGKKEFYSLDFKVTPDVLIPRPETEHVVMVVLDRIKARGNAATTVCDVCSGSGCIAVTVAKRAPSAQVTAVDISTAAIAIARENAVKHGVGERVEFIEGDLLSAIAAEAKFDIIASNPPYVSSSEYEALPTTVRSFEPRMALESGERGTEIIERLIPQAAEHLNAGGSLFIEISPMIAAAAKQLAVDHGAFSKVEILKDLAGQERVIAAQRK